MGFTYYYFFAGGGMAGIGLGPEWTCTFADDFDEVKASAYKAYDGGRALAVKDVRQVTVAESPGRADLAWASFPCQDLSRRRRGGAQRRAKRDVLAVLASDAATPPGGPGAAHHCS